jgi:hypothetical protein
MRASWPAKTLALAAFSTLLAVPAFAAGSPPQDLHGTWRLNDDLTARMMENERQSHPDDKGVQQRGESRRRGGPGDPGGMGGTPGGFEDEGRTRKEAPPPSFAGLNEVKIDQAAGKVTITDANGKTRVLWTDNRRVTDPDTPGGPSELRAKWDDDGSLVVEVQPKSSPKRTETWLVSNDRKLLYMTVEMENGRRGGTRIRRAYDAVVPEPKDKTKEPEKKPAAPAPTGDSELTRSGATRR